MKPSGDVKKRCSWAGVVVFLMLAFDGLAAAQVCVPAPPGSVSWWPGDGDATDLVNSNDGTVHGATFAPGRVAQAFSFDGLDDFVEVAPSPSLQFGTGDFTLEFWAKISEPFVNVQALITTQPVATDPPGILVHSRGSSPPAKTVLFDIRDGASTQTIAVPVPTDRQFHFFAFTRSGTTVKGYVDGIDQTIVLNASGVANMSSAASLFLGRNGLSTPVGHYFEGQLDELHVYNRALSASEILGIFNAGSGGKCKVPVTIDIKPGSSPNSTNPKSRGMIPVAILTTVAADNAITFDAATIDPNTVRFGQNGTEATPLQSALEDVDGDGDTDLILHFNIQDTGIVCGVTSAHVTGATFGRQTIDGSDSIRTVGCG